MRFHADTGTLLWLAADEIVMLVVHVSAFLLDMQHVGLRFVTAAHGSTQLMQAHQQQYT
jgi:hypothetical protein